MEDTNMARKDDEGIGYIRVKNGPKTSATATSASGTHGLPDGNFQNSKDSENVKENVDTDAGIGNIRVKKGPETSATATSATRTHSLPDGNFQNSEDSENVKEDVDTEAGRFGWVLIDTYLIPYITRVINNERIKFVSVRMAESEMLSTFLHYLHPHIFNTCTSVKSYIITKREAQLLNIINEKHSENTYGRDKFVEGKDFIVRAEDAKEFYFFIEMCYKRLITNHTPDRKEKCGFISINTNDVVVPYCIKDNTMYFPLFYFEGELNFVKNHAIKFDNNYWELAYIKFCCMVHGISSQFFPSDSCLMITFEDVKSFNPPDAKYMDYWPAKVNKDFLVLRISNHVNPSGSWIKKPDTLGIESIPISTSGNVQNSSLRPSSASILMPSMPICNNSYQNGWPSNQLNSAMLQQTNRNNTNVQSSNSVRSDSIRSTQFVSNTVLYSNGNGAPPTNQSMTAMYQSTTSGNIRGRQVQLTPHGQQQKWILLQVNSKQRTGNTLIRNTLQANITAPVVATIDLTSSPPSSPGPSAILPPPDTNGLNSATMIYQIPELKPAYMIQKVPHEGKILNCINATAFAYGDWMVTLNEFVLLTFPAVTVIRCAQVLNKFLDVVLYRGNSVQVAMLRQNITIGLVHINEVILVRLNDMYNVLMMLKGFIFKTDSEIATIQTMMGTPPKRRRT